MEFLKFALVIILATAVVINIIFVFHYAFANKLLPQVVMYINKRQNNLKQRANKWDLAFENKETIC